MYGALLIIYIIVLEFTAPFWWGDECLLFIIRQHSLWNSVKVL